MRTKVIAALALLLVTGAVRAGEYDFTGQCVEAATGNGIAGLVVECTFIFPDGAGGSNTWTQWCFTDNAGNWTSSAGPSYNGNNTAVVAHVLPGQPWKCNKIDAGSGFGPGTLALPAFQCVANPGGQWMGQ
jgi:hypothetical protein